MDKENKYIVFVRRVSNSFWTGALLLFLATPWFIYLDGEVPFPEPLTVSSFLVHLATAYWKPFAMLGVFLTYTWYAGHQGKKYNERTLWQRLFLLPIMFLWFLLMLNFLWTIPGHFIWEQS